MLDAPYSLGEDIFFLWARSASTIYLYRTGEMIELDEESFRAICIPLS